MKTHVVYAAFLALTLMAVGAVCSPFATAQILEHYREYKLPEHREKSDKLDFLFKASKVGLAAGTVFDVTSTATWMNGPTLASRPNGLALARVNRYEAGWTGNIFGSHSTAGAVAGNLALSFGIAQLSNRIYRKGGKWRILAIALNTWKGVDGTMAGIHNVGLETGVDRRVRMATGYSGRIVWSH